MKNISRLSLMTLVISCASFSGYASHSNLDDTTDHFTQLPPELKSPIYQALLDSGDIKALLSLHNDLKDRLETHAMLVRQYSALSKVLAHLSPDDTLFQMQPTMDNDTLVHSLCQKLFDANIDDNSPQSLRNKSIVQHLLPPFNVISANNQDLNEYEFKKLVTHLNALKNKNTYLSLEEALELAQKGKINAQNTFITMSDEELSERSRKQDFETLLYQHPELTLLFDVGQRFVTDGVLSMSDHDLPSNLRHLILTNAQGNATSIGDFFLAGASRLTSFDSSGLTNVTSIGKYFLAGANSLTSFDSSGLTNLTSIGKNFLFGANSLTSFDSSALTNLTSIGESFLFGARCLTSFDSSGLTNLTSIGDRFLFGIPELDGEKIKTEILLKGRK